MNVALSFPACHRRGGVERIMFECARFLASRAHEVTVLADEWERDDTARIRYRRVPTGAAPGFLRGLAYFRRCTRELSDLRFDVLNTHGCVCPTGGVQWVQSLHRAWLDRSRMFRARFSRAGMKQRLNPVHPILLRLESEHFGKRRYRKLIATTEQVRRDLAKYYGVPESDVVVIPNGFSPEEFNPQRRLGRRAEVRERLGLRNEHTALLFVANELERKGYRTLLDAVAMLKQPDVRVLVVGRADARAAAQMADARGLGGQVIICGSTSDVSQYHAAADALVLPTQYEAFCLAILEALGSGLPVITTNVPGAADAICPGQNGLLVEDPSDASGLMNALATVMDRSTREELASNASPSVERFQWPRILIRYEQVLAENCT